MDQFFFGEGEVNISGGTVRSTFANPGSIFSITGGAVGDSFRAQDGSVVNISGGTVGSEFQASPGSTVNISGGTVGDFFFAVLGSQVNISGGVIGNRFRAEDGSAVNIRGSEFQIDGVDLEDFLVGTELDAFLLGQSVNLNVRDVTLSGLLSDGELFSFDLNSAFSASDDIFEPGATLTLTLAVPEPSSATFITLAVAMGVVRRRR